MNALKSGRVLALLIIVAGIFVVIYAVTREAPEEEAKRKGIESKAIVEVQMRISHTQVFDAIFGQKFREFLC